MADDSGFGKGGSSGGSGGGFSFGSSTFSSIGGAANDLFAGFAAEYKEKGAQIEAAQYREAAGFARQNVGFTETSTAIKLMQQERQNQLTLGGQQADVAGAGFEASGSALDLLRDSASQGALTKQVLGFQGQITEAGYEEQAKALESQAEAADVAAEAAKSAAKGSFISSAIKGVAAVASIAGAAFTGGASLAALPAIAAIGE